MKVRDSGMPPEDIWSSFFDVELILSELSVHSGIRDLVEIGCGYGTFTIPSAKRISGRIYAFDIEKEMLEIVRKKTKAGSIQNVILKKRDVLTRTTGLNASSADYVMLFNILHNENPADFINEAYRVLTPGGKVGILHWRNDIETPRGPHKDIRPSPSAIKSLLDDKKFSVAAGPKIIGPFHFGMVLVKTRNSNPDQ